MILKWVEKKSSKAEESSGKFENSVYKLQQFMTIVIL